MIDLPKDGSDIKIVDRGVAENYQSEGGWQVVGIITEDHVEIHQRENRCEGRNDNGGTCQHGNFNGNCGMVDNSDVPIKVTRPLIVLSRSPDDLLADLANVRANLVEANMLREHATTELGSLRTEHATLKRLVAEKDKTIENLNSDIVELSGANGKVNRERTEVLQENGKLRTVIHADAMARIGRASEAACSGLPMNPLAFVALLDSFDHISAEPADYVALLHGWIERGVISDQRDQHGNRSLMVVKNDEFRNGLRELDARKRLAACQD
jgi:hypothetical protein